MGIKPGDELPIPQPRPAETKAHVRVRIGSEWRGVSSPIAHTWACLLVKLEDRATSDRDTHESGEYPCGIPMSPVQCDLAAAIGVLKAALRYLDEGTGITPDNVERRHESA